MRVPHWFYRWMHRRKLSRHGLRGGRLHAWFGDRLLAKELWKPTRTGLARAWLIGFPITMIPLLPVQSVFACTIGIFIRANLLMCIALQFLSTPLTAPIHLPACYAVGKWVLGDDPAEELKETPTTWTSAKKVFVPLYLGAAVLGVAGGLVGYALINAWPEPRRGRGPPGAPARSPPADG